MSAAPHVGHSIPLASGDSDGETWKLLNPDLAGKLWLFAKSDSKIRKAVKTIEQRSLEGGFSIEWGVSGEQETLYEETVGMLVKPNKGDETSVFRDLTRFRVEDKLNAVIGKGKGTPPKRVRYSGMYESLKRMLSAFDTGTSGSKKETRGPSQLAELASWNKQWVKHLMQTAMMYKAVFGMCPFVIKVDPRHEQRYIAVPEWGTGMFVGKRLPQGTSKYGYTLGSKFGEILDGTPTVPVFVWNDTRPDLDDIYSPFNSDVARLFPTWIWYRRQLRYADDASREMSRITLMLQNNARVKPPEELTFTETFATTLAEGQRRQGQGGAIGTIKTSEQRQLLVRDREALERQQRIAVAHQNDLGNGHAQFRLDVGIDSHLHLVREEPPWMTNAFMITGGLTPAPLPQPRMAVDPIVLRSWWEGHVYDSMNVITPARASGGRSSAASRTVAENRTIAGQMKAIVDDWRGSAKEVVSNMWFFLMKEVEYGAAEEHLDELDQEKRKIKLLLNFYEKIINKGDPTLELQRLRDTGIVKINDFDDTNLGKSLETLSKGLENNRKFGDQTVVGAPEDFDKAIAEKKSMERARAIHALQSILETDELIKRRDDIASLAERMDMQVDREKLMAELMKARTDKQGTLESIRKKRKFLKERLHSPINLTVAFTAVHSHEDLELFWNAYDRGVYSFDVVRAITNHRLGMPPDTPSGKPIKERDLELAKHYALPPAPGGTKRAAPSPGASETKKVKVTPATS